jgi:hypothetical protein
LCEIEYHQLRQSSRAPIPSATLSEARRWCPVLGLGFYEMELLVLCFKTESMSSQGHRVS